MARSNTAQDFWARALLRDLGVRVSVSRPGPRRLVVERIEIRALHAMV